MSSLLSSVASRDRKFTTSDISVISVFNMIAFDRRRAHVPSPQRANVRMRIDESSLAISRDLTSAVRCLDFGVVPA